MSDNGQFTVTELPDGKLRIDKADPVVWISPELLASELHPDALFVDDVLTVHAVGRTVAYRVDRGTRDKWGNYRAEWPSA